MPQRNLRQAVAMTDEEVAAFLALRLTMSLATNGADGWPHVVAMWYGFVGRAPGFLTYRDAQKFRNLERDPRVSCLVEDGERYDNLRGVMLRGRAEVIEHEDERLTLATNIIARYQGPVDEAGIDTVRASISKRVALRIEIQEVASWDHRKLVAT